MQGIRQISGLNFTKESGFWIHKFSDKIEIVRNYDDIGTKCTLHDSLDDSFFNFDTVVAARNFAKRKRHGRTLAEHHRAEALLTEKEQHGWSIKETAEKCGVSPRTIEAWFSGCRVVPVNINL